MLVHPVNEHLHQRRPLRLGGFRVLVLTRPTRQAGGMERVLGIGGYFVRAADPEALSVWYRECLGLDADENGLWRQGAGPTVFATLPDRAVAARLTAAPVRI
jgi:hypothetical protein